MTVLDLILATTNFQAGMSPGRWALNLASLRLAGVIVIAEPGNVSQPDRYTTTLLSQFHASYTPRQNVRPDQRHRGGCLVLVRKACFPTISTIPIPPAITSLCDVQLAAAQLRNASGIPVAVVLGCYMTPIENDSDAVICLSNAIDWLKAQFPSIPIITAGDFNARHIAFGDDITNTRGRLLRELVCATLFKYLQDRQVENQEPFLISSLPHRPCVCHCRSSVVWCTPITMRCWSTSPPVLERGIINQSSQSRVTSTKLSSNAVPKAPTVEQIIHAAHHSVFSAVSLLRRPSARLVIATPPSELLARFGARGLQRTHGNAPILRFRPAVVTPVCAQEVYRATQSLNVRASDDFDGIPSRLVQLAGRSDLFCERFADLTTACLTTGTVPCRWTQANAIPIPKHVNPAELRPILLGSNIAKVADRIMVHRADFETRVHPKQFGFRRGVPIDVVPLACIGLLHEALTRPRTQTEPVRGILLLVDQSGAFPGTATLHILDGYESIGLQSDGLAFRTAMLTNRRMRVSVNGVVSSWEEVVDGTNQGSVSGPKDYSASTTPLLQSLDSWRSRAVSSTRDFGMIADDLVGVAIGKMNDIEIAARDFFQTVAAWCATKGARLSSKTTALLFGHRNSPNISWGDRRPFLCGDLRITPQTAGYLVTTSTID
jgi:hypothetical protein